MKASVKKEGEYIQIFACIKISYLAHYDIGISESERQKRKESNKISTKINFFAWTIEVPAHEKRKINSKCLPQLAGLLFMVLPTSIPSPVRLILNREQNSHIFFFTLEQNFSLRKIFVLPRLTSLCLTPMFYIMAAENEKLKSLVSWLCSCCRKSNSVSPLNSTLP